MKDIRQIRENYNLVTEKAESDANKLTALVRAGLFESKKLPIVKRALEKDPNKLTQAERKVVMSLLEGLMSEVLNSQQMFSEAVKPFDGYLSKSDPRLGKMPTDNDIPAVLILKRKAIRIYPDNQKVALYYSQALDRYVTIPFGVVGAMNEAYRVDRPNEDEDEDGRIVSTRYEKVKSTRKRKNIADLRAKVRELEKASNPDVKEITSHKAKLKAAIDGARKQVVTKKIDLYQSDYTKLSPQNQKRTISALKSDPDVGLGTQMAVRAGLAAAKFLAKRKAAAKPTPTAKPTVTEQQMDEVAPLGLLGLGGAAAAGTAARGAAVAGGAALSRAGTKVRNFFRRRGRTAARTADAAADVANAVGGGNSGGGPDAGPGYQRKFSTPAEFGHLQVTTSKSQSPGVRTAIDARDASLNRRATQSMIKEMKNVKKTGKATTLYVKEEAIEINTNVAEKVVSLYESLNNSNKKVMTQMLSESPESFKKIVNFAVRQ